MVIINHGFIVATNIYIFLPFNLGIQSACKNKKFITTALHLYGMPAAASPRDDKFVEPADRSLMVCGGNGIFRLLSYC